MPIYTFLPAPQMVACWPPFSGGTVAIVAGKAHYAAFEIYGVTTFSQMRTVIGAAPTGNVDMGIYDATGTNAGPGTLLAHTGAIAATAGVFTKPLTANLTIGPGRYWIALLDTVADTFTFMAPGQGLGNGMGPYYTSSATGLTVLPATAGAVTIPTNIYGFEALTLGGYQ